MFYQNPYYYNNYYNSNYYRRPYYGGYYPNRQVCFCRGGYCRCDFGKNRHQKDYWGGWGY